MGILPALGRIWVAAGLPGSRRFEILVPMQGRTGRQQRARRATLASLGVRAACAVVAGALAGCAGVPPAGGPGEWVACGRLAGARVAAGELAGPLRIGDGCFLDSEGRAVMLRGINVSGSCKLPVRGGAGGQQGRFAPAGEVSFTGRPFPLDEAPRHFARLAGWGFHFVRLLVSWEAIEGHGPGVHDGEYLTYVERLAAAAGRAGLRVLVDFHQDVWSRFTGGDGAPRWTLEEAGFDVGGLKASGAALFADQYAGNPAGGVWTANHERLACATMFTLFFAGDDFAPRCRAGDGTPIQQFLQRHYLDAAAALAARLRGHRNVIGFEVMNEPGAGFIGRARLDRCGVFALDAAPTPLEAFAAGSGMARRVASFRLGPLGPARCGRVTLNAGGASAWQAGRPCIWRQHGVWGLDDRGEPVLTAPGYFACRGGRPVDFVNDYYRPFVERFARRIRGIDRRFVVGVEEPVMAEDPQRSGVPDWRGAAPPGVVNTSHWYDIAALATRRCRGWLAVDPDARAVVLGSGPVARLFDRQLAGLRRESAQRIGPRPVLVGEFGVPFNRRAAGGGGPFRLQQRALGRQCRALEQNLLGSALWHYGPGSLGPGGDGWCGEDFAIWCGDSGGRALGAVARPYPLAVPGRLLEAEFDPARGEFRCRFERDPAVRAPCLVCVPAPAFGDGFAARADDGSLAFDRGRRLLVYQPGPAAGARTLVVAARAGR